MGEKEIAVIVSSLITLLGVIITAFVTFQIYKKQTYVNSVAKERIQWLENFRKELGDLFAGFCVSCCFKGKSKCNDEKLKILSNAEIARVKLISRLKVIPFEGNEGNYRLRKILMNVSFKNCNVSNNKINKEEILNLSNYILEREWAKIKGESK